jgi:uncharacterized protein (DUF924 family)
MPYTDIINFWFQEITPKQWWIKDPAFDQMVADRFLPLHAAATRCELHTWRSEPMGRLAEVIVLDQFSRNIYRGKPQSFASDPMALCLAQEAVRSCVDLTLDNNQKMFLYMPFMHSESAAIHQIAVGLFSTFGEQGNQDYELKHKAIIDRFGRFPHRNAILGRPSTAEELEFLAQPGSSF